MGGGCLWKVLQKFFDCKKFVVLVTNNIDHKDTDQLAQLQSYTNKNNQTQNKLNK